MMEATTKIGHFAFGGMEFDGVHCARLEYAQGGPALRLFQIFADGDTEQLITATRWVPGLAGDEVVIANYNEGEGLTAALQEAGIIGPRKRFLTFDYVTLPVCDIIHPDLLPPALLARQAH